MILFVAYVIGLILNIANMFFKNNKFKILTALNIFLISSSILFMFEFE